VHFDRPRVLCVLGRIAADLDELARRPMEAAEGDEMNQDELFTKLDSRASFRVLLLSEPRFVLRRGAGCCYNR
jgi:hypothetical protein